jgi:pimeloyl-ACP methyl ester carboxylesterase
MDMTSIRKPAPRRLAPPFLLALALLMPAGPAGCAAPIQEKERGAAFRELRYPGPLQKTRLLRAGDQEIAYSESGKGDRALLLIHGLGSSMPVWSRNVQALARQHRVVAIDLPGYGKSSKGPYPYSMAFFAEVVDRVIDALGLRRVVLIGHSMGGQIALTHALLRPKKAEALVLVAPAGLERFTPAEAELLTRMVTPEAVVKTPPDRVRLQIAANFVQMPAEAEFLVRDRLRVIGGPDFGDYAHAVSRSVAAMLDGPVYDRLPEIAVPALVLFGDKDALIPNRPLHGGGPRQVAEAGAARLPGGRLVMVPQGGHLLQFERPDEVNQAIGAFLASLPR